MTSFMNSDLKFAKLSSLNLENFWDSGKIKPKYNSIYPLLLWRARRTLNISCKKNINRKKAVTRFLHIVRLSVSLNVYFIAK